MLNKSATIFNDMLACQAESAFSGASARYFQGISLGKVDIWNVGWGKIGNGKFSENNSESQAEKNKNGLELINIRYYLNI